jgi:hypothetical protein
MTDVLEVNLTEQREVYKSGDKCYAELDKCEERFVDSETAQRNYAFCVGPLAGRIVGMAPSNISDFSLLNTMCQTSIDCCPYV